VLDDHTTDARVLGAHEGDAVEHVVDRADVLATDRHRYAGLAEQPASRALEPDRPQVRRRAIDRRAELEGDVHLVVGDVPRFDERGPVTDEPAQVVDEVGPVEQLGCHRPGPGVRHLEHVEVGTGVVAPPLPHERQVVVDHLRLGCLAAHEHDVAVLDPIDQQRREQVAVLQRRDPVVVVGQQRLADAERRQCDHDVLDPGPGAVHGDGLAEPLLQAHEGRVCPLHRGQA
jgi:hypothetical protein